MEKLPIGKERPEQEKPGAVYLALALAQGHGQQHKVSHDEQGSQFHAPDYRVVWVAKQFKFHTDEVLPELKLGYTTLGDPTHEAVVILHGTWGWAQACWMPANTSSSCLTPLALESPANPPTGGLRAQFPRCDFTTPLRSAQPRGLNP
jgi:hypothetical protein